MASETLDVKFQTTNPKLNLTFLTPDNATLAFTKAVVGRDGSGTGTVDVDEVAGFSTDPIFYYILNRD